jgi:hypothetical protein
VASSISLVVASSSPASGRALREHKGDSGRGVVDLAASSRPRRALVARPVTASAVPVLVVDLGVVVVRRHGLGADARGQARGESAHAEHVVHVTRDRGLRVFSRTQREKKTLARRRRGTSSKTREERRARETALEASTSLQRKVFQEADA